MINVFVVDDHALVRNGIKRLLADVNNIKVIGEASCGEDVVSYIRSGKPVPDVILMDIQMPGIGGLEATRKIMHIDPDIKIIVLTAHVGEPFPSRLMQAGAAGYLSKDSGAEEMIQAVRAVNSGQRYISPAIAQQLALKRFVTDEKSPLDSLSERELQVMLMITKGQKVQDISDKLHLSPKTVNSYRYRLFEKLGVSSDVELTHLAIRLGLIENMTSQADTESGL